MQKCRGLILVKVAFFHTTDIFKKEFYTVVGSTNLNIVAVTLKH